MTELMSDQRGAGEDIKRREIPPGQEGAGRGFTLAAALIALSAVLGVLLVWRTSSSLLIIFAGILFASFLDACARALGPVVPASRPWRLTLVILILTALVVLGAIWGIGKIPEQASLLIRVMDAQLEVLQQRLLTVGVLASLRPSEDAPWARRRTGRKTGLRPVDRGYQRVSHAHP